MIVHNKLLLSQGSVSSLCILMWNISVWNVQAIDKISLKLLKLYNIVYSHFDICSHLPPSQSTGRFAYT